MAGAPPVDERIRQGSTEAFRPMTEEVVRIHGYLHKLTRDGKWQRRWFETNGSFLTYYKSKRMTKLLAALSLPQCGAIRCVDKAPEPAATTSPLPAPPGGAAPAAAPPEPPDPDAGLFAIGLNDRTYTLRAPTKADAACWVKTLNILKHSGTEVPDDGADIVDAPSKAGAADAAQWEKTGRACTTFCWAPCRPGG